MNKKSGLLMAVGKLLYSLFLMFALGYGAYYLYQTNISFWYKLIDQSLKSFLLISIASVGLATVLDFVDKHLEKLNSAFLEWSLFGRNINFIPMDYVVLRVPFLLLFYFNLPLLSWIEEMIFRGDWFIHATSGWLDAAWRSVVFGAIHVLVGTKARTGVLIFFCGLWLSWLFMQGGIEPATLAHLSIDTAGLTLLLLKWAKTGKNPFIK